MMETREFLLPIASENHPGFTLLTPVVVFVHVSDISMSIALNVFNLQSLYLFRQMDTITLYEATLIARDLQIYRVRKP